MSSAGWKRFQGGERCALLQNQIVLASMLDRDISKKFVCRAIIQFGAAHAVPQKWGSQVVSVPNPSIVYWRLSLVHCLYTIGAAYYELLHCTNSDILWLIERGQGSIENSLVAVMERRSLGALLARLASLCRSLARSICFGDFGSRLSTDSVVVLLRTCSRNREAPREKLQPERGWLYGVAPALR